MATLLVAAGLSAATAATVTSIASTVATVASIGTAIATPIIQGKREEKIAKANEQALRQEARDREVAGSIEAERQRRINRQRIASQTAGAAESGTLSGSTLDLLDANSVAMEMDALTVQYQGEVGGIQSNRRADLVAAEGEGAGTFGIFQGVAGGVSRGVQAFTQFDPLSVED